MTACEIKFPKTTTPCGAFSKVVLALTGVMIATASPAQAVDLVNRDKATREVTINASDGSSKTLNVKGGEKVSNICKDCVILVGDSSVETKGSATVKIEGGQVSIASQR